MYATNPASSSREPVAIGSFSSPSGGRLIGCNDGFQNAFTHSNNIEKYNATVTWNAPPDYIGSVEFK